MSKLIFFISSLFLLISITLSVPPKALALQCTNTTYVDTCTPQDKTACTDKAYNRDCTAVGFLCGLNPFCDKYTGNECAAIENNPGSPGGWPKFSTCTKYPVPVNSDFCQGSKTDYTDAFKVCWDATPTPTPTPTHPLCYSTCGTDNCTTCPSGSTLCGSTDINQCSVATPTPTPTPGPTCNASNCFNRSCTDASGFACQCYGTCSGNSCVTGGIVPGSCITPTPTAAPTPTPTPTPSCTPGSLFCSGTQICQCQSNGTSLCGACFGGTGTCQPDGNTAYCVQGNPTPPPTAAPTNAPPPPPSCSIYMDPNARCVTQQDVDNFRPYGQGSINTCDYTYNVFVNTCRSPMLLKYINQQPSGGKCVGTKYGCSPQSISGNIFIDSNGNGIREGGESLYSSNVGLTATFNPGPYCPEPGYWSGWYAEGNYGCGTATYQQCIDTTPWWVSSTQAQQTCAPWQYPVSPFNPACSTYGFCYYSGYNYDEEGNAFLQCNNCYPTPTPFSPAVTYFGGSYSVRNPNSSQDLPYGIYTININVPTNYTVTEPNTSTARLSFPNNPPDASGNYFRVTTAEACNKDGSKNASCNAGSIVNLNFGIKTPNAWIQTTGLDIRRDSGFSQQIPANATCGSYASLPGTGGSPGIIYSGESASNFGDGQASSTNWIVGGTTYPGSFTPTRPNLIRTSYNYLLSVAKQANITPIDIGTYCGIGGINNCSLPANLPNGLYISNGNLTLIGNAYTFPAGKNFVILINGDLTIKTKILVPNGSTAIFSSSKNILVDKSVGEASFLSTASSIEGYYSADKNFIADGNNDCSVALDKRLNIAGALITNAALSGGTFQNNRSLCTDNTSCPVFSIKERPDFVLNAPEFIKHPSYTYQETAP